MWVSKLIVVQKGVFVWSNDLMAVVIDKIFISFRCGESNKGLFISYLCKLFRSECLKVRVDCCIVRYHMGVLYNGSESGLVK